MVNFKYILKILSVLLLTLGAFMLIPFALTFYYKETYLLRSFLIPIGIIVLFALFSFTILRKSHPNFTTRDVFLLVTLSWLFSAFFGALPFYISGYIPSFVDAYFETMSGFTTTGASILTNIEAMPMSLLFWRSLTHWLGGMGIVVLLVALLHSLGASGLRLLQAESPGPTVDKMTSRIAHMAKILWLVYVGLSILEIILLLLGGMNLFDATTHTFGTMATGGFSPKSKSVGYYNSPFIHYVITIFMLFAGMNFVLFFNLLTGKIKDVLKNTELKVYLWIFFIATGIIVINLYKTVFPSISKSFQYASFQVASILTTTGFATTDFNQWPFLSKSVLFILMFIGGCAGSTGGGIKVIRFITLFKLVSNQLKYFLHPRGVFNIRINDKIIKKDVVYVVSGFFFIYILFLLLITLIVASGGNNIVTSFSTALVTLGNIGPGFGKIGPALNYAFYPAYIKWLLSFAMMAGRLEILTVLVIFVPLFWKNK